ncbi:hypothetical protein PDN08_05090 [Bacillus cereus]|nr:hypothetical protein [Bacillus cereus]MDA2204800.1 hypothetical protein [Bacillus cereus]MDA2752981.1 hypothetical protein [Bacillus cereus]
MAFAIAVRFRHSFHEIELLDIPNILFPSPCGFSYFQGRCFAILVNCLS